MYARQLIRHCSGLLNLLVAVLNQCKCKHDTLCGLEQQVGADLLEVVFRQCKCKHGVCAALQLLLQWFCWFFWRQSSGILNVSMAAYAASVAVVLLDFLAAVFRQCKCKHGGLCSITAAV